jgi:hypothetical protein
MKTNAGMPNPRSWKQTKLTTYPSGGTGSRWAGGGVIHSGCDQLVLGRSSPSSTNSSNLLSITKEAAQSSMRRIWLFPAIGAVGRGVDGEDAVAAATRAESAIRQGLSKVEDCRSARDWWGTQTPRP